MESSDKVGGLRAVTVLQWHSSNLAPQCIDVDRYLDAVGFFLRSQE